MNVRCPAFVVVIVWVLPAAALAGDPPRAQPPPAPAGTVSAHADIGEAIRVLGHTVENLAWDEVTLGYVINWLRGEGEVNVAVKYNALRNIGIDADSTVSLMIRRAAVAEILSEVFEQLADEGEVLFRATGTWIQISTAEDFNRDLPVRVYDVGDLLMRIPGFTGGPQIDSTAAQQAGGSGTASGGPVFRPSTGEHDQDESDDEIRQRLEELADVIVGSIDPLSWDINGGRGTIRTYNRMLIIRNSVEVHEQIAGHFRLDG